MNNEQDKLKEALIKEVGEIFDALDELFLDMEKDSSDADVLNGVFRRVHTLKGSFALFGFKPLERFTHLWEDLLDLLRSGELHATPEILDINFECLDAMKDGFTYVADNEDVPDGLFAVLESKIRGFLPHEEEDGAMAAPKAFPDKGFDAALLKEKAPYDKLVSVVGMGLRLYEVTVELDRECMKSGLDPLRVVKGLKNDGEILASAVIWDAELPKIDVIDPAHLYFSQMKFVYASKLGVSEMRSLLDFAEGLGAISLHQFTPGELKDHLNIDADPFWTEAGGASGDVEDEVLLKAITSLTEEIEAGVSAVRDHLLLFANEPSDKASLEKVYRFFHNLCDTAAVLKLEDIAEISAPLCSVMERVGVDGGTLSMEEIAKADSSLDEINALLRAHLKRAITEFMEQRKKGVEARSFVLAEALLGMGVVTREALDKAIENTSGEQKPVMLRRRAEDKRGAVAALRIDPARLDNLVDMVGELVIAQSQVTQDLATRGITDTRLDKNIAQLTRITSDIQDMVMGMRMLSLEQTFKKMSRVARDVSKSLGKDADFFIFGEETEVDKTIIDEIGDPLIHLIRNCVDHGIESPEDRIKAGKPARGRVELNAFHRGGNVVIEVKDDGKGLSKKKIIAKARESGLITDDLSMTDQQVYALIFEPGFSTAEAVTQISGRGVGLDAVKKSVENLRGKVEVATVPGYGSTFTIKLPLTLAIIEGMLVGVGGERYIVPTLSIESSFRPRKEDLTKVDSRGEVVKIRGAFHTLLRLHDIYRIGGAQTDPTESILVLVESEGRRACVMVDEILGHQHVVIKTLGDTFKGIKGVSGCTILGDGKVGLILDVSGLLDITIG